MRSTLAAVLLLPQLAHADVVPVASLEDRAVTTSPALRAARHRIAGAEAEVDEAAAARMPTVGVRADVSVAPGGEIVEVLGPDDRVHQVSATPTLENPEEAFAPVPRYGATVGARWRLLDFGRSVAAEQAAEFAGEAGRLTSEAAEREVRLAVRHAYLAWVFAHALHGIAVEGARGADERAARVDTLIRTGQRPEADGAAAAVDRATARLELARSEARLARARRGVESAVGEPLADDAEPDPAFLDAEMDPSAQDPIDRSLQARRAAAGALADAHSYHHRPTLDLEADVGLRGQTDSLFPLYRGAVVFSLPLYDGGVGSARERAARADAARIDAELDAHRRVRAAEDALAQTAAEQARATGEAAHGLVEAAQERLAAAEAAYDRGVGSTEVIATARESLRRARAEELTARAELAEARLR